MASMDDFMYTTYINALYFNEDLGLPRLEMDEFLKVFRAFPDEMALMKSIMYDWPFNKANRGILIRVFGGGAKPMEEANENSIQSKIPECPVVIFRKIIFC